MGLSVFVSSDKMRCTLDWTPQEEALTSPSKEDIREALKRASVKNVPDADLERLAAALTPDAPTSGLVVIEGRPPVEGAEGRIDWLFDSSIEQQSAGKIGDHGQINFRERRAFVEVNDGQVIARWTPPVPGEPGMNVLGEEIKVRNPPENRIQAGKNVTVSEDGTECRSTMLGHAFVAGRRVSVDRLFEVQGNVDFKSGNVRYPGNVQVRGDVLPGFVIEADGNVVIGGVIDGAEVRATGDVVVNGGILNNSRVFAKNSLSAKFVQDSHLEGGGDVTITDSLVQSTVGDCANLTTTSHGGSRGIIGGRVNCRGEVSTYSVGSDLAVKTVIWIGPSPKANLERRRLRTEIEEARKDLERLKHFITAGKDRPSSRPPGDGPEKLSKAYAVREEKLLKATQKLATLEASLGIQGAEGARARLRVHGIAHEGVEVWIYERLLQIDHAIQFAGFRFDQQKQEIVSSPL